MCVAATSNRPASHVACPVLRPYTVVIVRFQIGGAVWNLAGTHMNRGTMNIRECTFTANNALTVRSCRLIVLQPVLSPRAVTTRLR